MYQSQSNKERFCRHYTVKREHALPVKIMATTLFSRFRSIFCCFCLIHKTVVSTHKTVDNKARDQILTYSDNTLFRNKEANSGHSGAARPNCSENHFVEKTNQYHTCVLEFCTGPFVTSSLWESTLQNNLNKRINLVHPLFKLSLKVDSQRADVTSRPVQNSKTACVILISFSNKMVFRAVWLSSSRVTQICLPHF